MKNLWWTHTHTHHTSFFNRGFHTQSHNTKYREHASQENGKKMKPFLPTAVCNVTAWRHSGLRAHWLMALIWGGGLRKKYVFCVPRELQRFLSLSCLWEESLYLVLWFCGSIRAVVQIEKQNTRRTHNRVLGMSRATKFLFTSVLWTVQQLFSPGKTLQLKSEEWA